MAWPSAWRSLPPPAVTRAPELDRDGAKALFYENVPFKGKPTRVFAFVGMPGTAPGTKVPAMVLIHGGGASALSAWVRLWTDRGYAAISMDTQGCTPGPNPAWRLPDPHPRHADAGPAGLDGGNGSGDPVEDQWPFHVVSAVARAKALLAARPEVDAARIGLTGVSWGAVNALWAASATNWPCIVPVYGCGYLADTPLLRDTAAQPQVKRWLELWDPSRYVAPAQTPAWLWITSPADHAFDLTPFLRTAGLSRGERYLSLKPDMPHAHGGPGENQPEIFAFVDACLKNRVKPARVFDPVATEGVATAKFTGRVDGAELIWSADPKDGSERAWERIPAAVEDGVLRAPLPPDAAVWFLNGITAQDLVASSDTVSTL